MSEIQVSKSIGKKKKGKRKKIMYILIILVVVAVLSIGINELIKTKKYDKIVNGITITDTDLDKIPDGTYKGSFDAIRVASDVEVSVKDHKIQKINLINHKNERGKKAEKIIDDIVKAQSLKVDTISGATSSSKVILKSIQNALDSAEK